VKGNTLYQFAVASNLCKSTSIPIIQSIRAVNSSLQSMQTSSFLTTSRIQKQPSSVRPIWWWSVSVRRTPFTAPPPQGIGKIALPLPLLAVYVYHWNSRSCLLSPAQNASPFANQNSMDLTPFFRLQSSGRYRELFRVGEGLSASQTKEGDLATARQRTSSATSSKCRWGVTCC
jgi:hypothetical protein